MNEAVNPASASSVAESPVSQGVTPAAAQPAAGKAEPKEPLTVRNKDRIMALSMFLLAYLATEVFGLFTDPGLYGYGVTVLGIAYSLAIILYGRKGKEDPPRETYFWLAVLLAGAGSYSFVCHQSLKLFHPIFLRLTALYVTLVVSRTLIGKKTGSFFIFDGINMLFVIPFHNITLQWRIAKQEVIKLQFFSAVLKAALGLLVALPLLFIVALLLGSADDQFADLLVRAADTFGERFFTTIWAMIASLPVGCFLFALFYGSAHKRGTDTMKKKSLESVFRACAVIPAISFYAVLFVVSMLYILFIALQGGYFFSAVKGVLPVGFTYSEYARQGFFELVAISLINIFIIGMTQLFTRNKGIIIKGFYLLLSILTLLLILTAMTKMSLYIGVYGLTPLRVIPSVFMVFLALIFVLVIMSQIKTVPIAKISIYAFATGYVLLSVVDMDGIIAGYNLNRYQSGTLPTISEETLISGGVASIDAIYRIWEKTSDQDLKSDLEEIVTKIKREQSNSLYGSDSIKCGSFAKEQARARIRVMTE